MMKLLPMYIVVVLLLCMAAATTSLSQLQLRGAITTAGGGKGTSAGITMQGALGQAITPGRSSAGGLTLNGGFMPTLTLRDISPPSISHAPPSAAVAGQNLSITATVTDNGVVDSVLLIYRQGGEQSYSQIAMSGAASVYQGAIPGASVTIRGIEYYLLARDSSGNASKVPALGTYIVTVGYTSVTGPSLPSGSEQTAYRLISVPALNTARTAEAILSDDLGAYDSTQWRFFGLQANQTYVEYPATAPMDPGRAFWLLVRASGKMLTMGPGVNTPLDRPFSIRLDSGWTFVGNPFAFPIPFGFLSRFSGTFVSLRAYNGSWAAATSPMQPYSGYAIANNSPVVDTLRVNPRIFPSAPPVQGDLPSMEASLWTIRVQAQVEEAQDNDNVIAAVPGSSREWDELDEPEPPVIGGFVSVNFPHPEWGKVLKTYSTDVRPEPTTGDVWPMDVRTNIRDDINLAFSGLERVPNRFNVLLVDDVLKTVTDLRETGSVRLPRQPSDTPRHLFVVVGTPEFAQAKLHELDALPGTFGLDQNFPNPFNPTTTIRYALPKSSVVSLKVFNAIGQLVKSIDQDVRSEGYHTFEFDGADLSSGVYYYRLVAVDQTSSATVFSAQKKMILLK